MLQHYKYPLKVWLTNVLFGSIGLFTITYIYQRDMFIAYNLISYFIPVTFYIALGAIPFWLCLWYVYSRLVKSGKQRKIMLLLTVELSGFAYFAIMSVIYPSPPRVNELLIITSFAIAIAIAVIIYPIHKVKPKEIAV